MPVYLGGVFQHLDPIGTPGALGRGSDDGVDLFGIQGALNHQRFRNRQNRHFGEAEQQIGINCRRQTPASTDLPGACSTLGGLSGCWGRP
jgi:hypothetical protein